MEEQQVKEILNKYKRIAKLHGYEKEDLKKVIARNANYQEREIISDYLRVRVDLLEKEIKRENFDLAWNIFWVISQLVILYLLFFTEFLFEHRTLIFCSLSLLSFAMLFLSPFKRKPLSIKELGLEKFKTLEVE